MIQEILHSIGWKKAKYSHVGGGDINDAYHIIYEERSYFLKINDRHKFPDMLLLEAKGLKLLRDNGSLQVPNVISCGTTEKYQYMALEWIERTHPKPDFWWEFGRSVAEMHRVTNPFFGLDHDNYIGSLQQQNKHNTSWPDFFATRRILPLVERLYNRADISKVMLQQADQFCNRVKEIFPEEVPALLHGDLWRGNFMSGKKGQVAIYDPAVYFGHREMEIGMTKLFDGFHDEFFHAYNETLPLESGWEKRVKYSQTYPLLVHAVLFGGHYIEEAFNAMK